MVGTVLGVVSELVECGRARFQRGEYEDAREALEDAVKRASDASLQVTLSAQKLNATAERDSSCTSTKDDVSFL